MVATGEIATGAFVILRGRVYEALRLCASRNPAAWHNRDKGGRMAGKYWQIEGKYVEYCSCDHGCPCESMAEPTYGDCTGLVAFKIDKGYCEDVRLDDLAVVAAFYFPRAIHHG